MKISILQPEIIRGDVAHNAKQIQALMDCAQGDLLVLAEYALTGSLVLDEHADVPAWTAQSDAAQSSLVIPDGKRLLLNRLVLDQGEYYNQSQMLPQGGAQRKCWPDQPELDAGISSGEGFKLFDWQGKRFITIVCSDLRNAGQIPTDGADFALFIFHFTPKVLDRVVAECMAFSQGRGIPVIAASLCSDQNNGHSAYIHGKTVVALGNQPGILELTL